MRIDDVAHALRTQAQALQEKLRAAVDRNLSGEVLQSRSGTLKASIVTELAADESGVTASIASRGVPYAAILEFGGTTAPHEIVPVKGAALAFAGGAGKVFARRVHHPGSVLAPRAYLGGALDALHDEILGGLKESVRAALGAN